MKRWSLGGVTTKARLKHVDITIIYNHYNLRRCQVVVGDLDLTIGFYCFGTTITRTYGGYMYSWVKLSHCRGLSFRILRICIWQNSRGWSRFAVWMGACMSATMASPSCTMLWCASRMVRLCDEWINSCLESFDSDSASTSCMEQMAPVEMYGSTRDMITMFIFFCSPNILKRHSGNIWDPPKWLRCGRFPQKQIERAPWISFGHG